MTNNFYSLGSNNLSLHQSPPPSVAEDDDTQAKHLPPSMMAPRLVSRGEKGAEEDKSQRFADQELKRQLRNNGSAHAGSCGKHKGEPRSFLANF